jgi:epsilon-lactone hydrolase
MLAPAAGEVLESMSHAQYLLAPYAPETNEAFAEITHFFDAHLGG